MRFSVNPKQSLSRSKQKHTMGKIVGKLLCKLGIHKQSPYTKYRFYGKDFPVCQRCKKIYNQD